MDRADAVSIHHKVTDLVAVRLPGGGAVEARGEDAFFEHKHTAYKGAVTGTALGYGISDLHEIGVPIWAHAIPPGDVSWANYITGNARELRFPLSKKGQCVTECGIHEAEKDFVTGTTVPEMDAMYKSKHIMPTLGTKTRLTIESCFYSYFSNYGLGAGVVVDVSTAVGGATGVNPRTLANSIVYLSCSWRARKIP